MSAYLFLIRKRIKLLVISKEEQKEFQLLPEIFDDVKFMSIFSCNDYKSLINSIEPDIVINDKGNEGSESNKSRKNKLTANEEKISISPLLHETYLTKNVNKNYLLIETSDIDKLKEYVAVCRLIFEWEDVKSKLNIV